MNGCGCTHPADHNWNQGYWGKSNRRSSLNLYLRCWAQIQHWIVQCPAQPRVCFLILESQMLCGGGSGWFVLTLISYAMQLLLYAIYLLPLANCSSLFLCTTCIAPVQSLMRWPSSSHTLTSTCCCKMTRNYIPLCWSCRYFRQTTYPFLIASNCWFFW